MPRKLLRRYLPADEALRAHPHLRVLGARLHDPNLWHLNRRSVAGGLAVGLFVAFLPIVGQMPLAALVALLLRVNLPIAVVGVWLTNPLTMGPIFLFAYHVGAAILGTHEAAVPFEVSFRWLGSELGAVWRPLLLGCLICGTVSSAAGYAGARILWRLHVLRAWRGRRRPVG
ncbi:DUF2062 domain-containing protein [Inmirania thermothiophila]|uniref:DUF2062 domain-containing protein n=1 Tax=Inmirania thermothiophila TaxID=1750597 RepID=A0A3N1Y1F4_9GAMM|nr:DUF2062 domain-containing protein [Inmirania thermothiophila]ROR32656.1 hypothetical protein EDC57_1862 [Inmirania thermothiophila]